MNRVLAALALLTAVLLPARTVAHPHVWVDATVEFQFQVGHLVGLTLDWTFDPFFSAVLFDEFDVNDDGAFDGDEITAIREAAFNGLGDVGYFTDLRIDGALQRWGAPETFSVAIGAEGAVSYRFTLMVAEPAPALDADITVSLYDPEFYVEVLLNEQNPIRMVGADGFQCGYVLEKAEDNPIYFDMVFPIRAVLVCESLSG